MLEVVVKKQIESSVLSGHVMFDLPSRHLSEREIEPEKSI